MMLLFRLGGLLSSPEKVKEIAGLRELPVVREGMSEMGIVQFCAVDKEAQKKLEQWLAQKAVLQTRLRTATIMVSRCYPGTNYFDDTKPLGGNQPLFS